MSSPDGLVLRHADSVEELDVLEPLWGALQEHHEGITPSLGEGTPKRGAAESWRFRR